MFSSLHDGQHSPWGTAICSCPICSVHSLGMKSAPPPGVQQLADCADFFQSKPYNLGHGNSATRRKLVADAVSSIRTGKQIPPTDSIMCHELFLCTAACQHTPALQLTGTKPKNAQSYDVPAAAKCSSVQCCLWLRISRRLVQFLAVEVAASTLYRTQLHCKEADSG